MNTIDSKSLGRLAEAPITGESLAEALRWMAEQASKMGAATMSSEMEFSAEDEEADGDFIPSIVLKVRKVQ